MIKNTKNILWIKCIKYLQTTIPIKNFIEYINPLQIYIKKNTVTILTPNNYIKEKIEKNYISIIKNIIQNFLKTDLKIQVNTGTIIKKDDIQKVYPEEKNFKLTEKNKNNLVDSKNTTSIENIIENVIEYYNIKKDDIKNKNRTKKVVKARQIIFFLAKNFTNLTLYEIGQMTGTYTHAYVIYSYKKIKKILKVKENIQKEIEEIIKKL